MTKIVRTDIELAKTSNARKLVSEDAEEANKLKEAIKKFIEESKSNNKLTGDVWEQARARLEECCNVLDKRISASEALLLGIDAANNKMEAYLNMDPSGDEFDDAVLPDLKNELSQAKANKSAAEAELAIEQAGHTYTDPKTGESTTTYDYAKIAQLQAQIESLKKVIEDLEKMIRKLDLLVPYDEDATSALNSNYESAQLAYKTAVSQLATMKE